MNQYTVDFRTRKLLLRFHLWLPSVREIIETFVWQPGLTCVIALLFYMLTRMLGFAWLGEAF